jgi:hypothetical protein
VAIKDHLPTIPGNEPTDGYWLALGAFIHQFSAVERMLQRLLRIQAGVSGEIAKSVFSGARVDACKDFINRICDATGREDVKARLEPAFAQLGAISTMRNAIVHWGASVQPDDTLAAVNDFLAHTPLNLKNFPVSPEILRDMTFDLMMINVHIAREIANRMRDLPDGLREKMETALDGGAVMRRNLGVAGPWLYKPPQPPPPEKGTRARRGERQRQQHASGK